MAEPIKTEQWKIIKSFPDYAISNFGKVKRITKANGTKIGLMLSPLYKKGYHSVCLSSHNIKCKHKQIHHLVLEAFVSPRPEGKQCNHKDGNPTNNQLENLEWVTSSQNNKHSYDVLGRIGVRGKRHPLAKLEEAQVRQIRYMWATGFYFQKELARRFNVSQCLICSIVHKKHWKHI